MLGEIARGGGREVVALLALEPGAQAHEIAPVRRDGARRQAALHLELLEPELEPATPGVRRLRGLERAGIVSRQNEILTCKDFH